MSCIAKVRSKLLKPYRRAEDAAKKIQSAKDLAVLILENDMLHYRHRKRMLSEVLWFLSEADGKYSTRYRSAEVMRLARNEPQLQVKVQHEHVFPRNAVVEDLLHRREHYLSHRSELDARLDETVGCVVTVEEHRRLIPNAHGWDRYASVPVEDMALAQPD